jgi:hypothetical protein
MSTSVSIMNLMFTEVHVCCGYYRLWRCCAVSQLSIMVVMRAVFPLSSVRLRPRVARDVRAGTYSGCCWHQCVMKSGRENKRGTWASTYIHIVPFLHNSYEKHAFVIDNPYSLCVAVCAFAPKSKLAPRHSFLTFQASGHGSFMLNPPLSKERDEGSQEGRCSMELKEYTRSALYI